MPMAKSKTTHRQRDVIECIDYGCYYYTCDDDNIDKKKSSRYLLLY